MDVSILNTEKTLLIACGALAHEILDIMNINQLSHLTLECLPAQLHNTPDQIPERVKSKIHDARSRGFSKIYCVYADCGTGGLLDNVLEEEGVERIAGPHCYSFFSGNNTFLKSSDDEITSFYLTDFLAKQFNAFVVKPLGLDRHPELKEMYFGNYEKIVYLAQNGSPEYDKAAEDAARFLGLAYEKRETGYGDLATSLTELR